MKKILSFFTFCMALTSLVLSSCSGNSDDPTTGEGGEATSITLQADKTTIEASGKDVITFTVLDNNGTDLTKKYPNEVYITVDGISLGYKVHTYASVENGEHKVVATYKDFTSEEMTIKVQNRAKYEEFYRKVAVFKLTGTWCPGCPAMTATLKKVDEKMPNRMVKLAFHTSNGEQKDPFEIATTMYLAGQYGIGAYPTNLYNLNAKSKSSGLTGVIDDIQTQLIENPSTCGLKVVSSSYNAGTVSVKAGIKAASTVENKEYDLAYAVVEDGLAYAGGTEDSGIYDYTVIANTGNFMSFSDEKFKLSGGQEKVLDFTLTDVKIKDVKNARIVVYALTQKDGSYIIDNIIECPIGESTDYVLNK